MQNVHTSVLLKETIDGLEIENGNVFLDATLGGGGHSAEVARRFGKKVKIIGLDLDGAALKRAEEEVKPLSDNFIFRIANFRDLSKVLDEIGQKTVDRILFDLGLSSNQLENSGRGFSFKRNEPLLMTFGEQSESHLSAKEIVNTWQEESLADIIYGYGGERFSRRIAKAIVATRKKSPIATTGDLVKLISGAVPAYYRHGKIHFATRTFQALRITVNDELGALEKGLEDGIARLSGGGRMAVISFHSLEDRLVKRFFNNKKKEEMINIVNKKPIVPARTEILENPRARSAKLRLIEKIK